MEQVLEREEVFVGDVGTEIVLDCKEDISAATAREIVARRPNGTRVAWSAVADGTTAIKYVTQDGDLCVAGNWKLQARVELPGWSGRGEVASLVVLSAL